MTTMTTKPEKFIITGTGRAGTTFCVRLFTHLGLDTGYTPETMENHVWRHCNAGLERPIGHKNMILKNPTFLTSLAAYHRSLNLFVIIPLRELEESAASRARNGKNPGGLWDAKTVEEQVDKYETMMMRALYDIVQNDIPHAFLDFKRMIASWEYMYGALKVMMDRFAVTPEAFQVAWEKASEVSRPRPENQEDYSARRVQQKVQSC
jgi:hypothetical protein